MGVSKETFSTAFKIVYSGYSGWRDYVVNYLDMKRYKDSEELRGIIEMAAMRNNKEKYRKDDYDGPTIKFARRRVFKKPLH